MHSRTYLGSKSDINCRYECQGGGGCKATTGSCFPAPEHRQSVRTATRLSTAEADLMLFYILHISQEIFGSVSSSRSHFVRLSGFSQVCLRSLWVCIWSVSGLLRLSLAAFLAYFVGQTEPKICTSSCFLIIKF